MVQIESLGGYCQLCGSLRRYVDFNLKKLQFENEKKKKNTFLNCKQDGEFLKSHNFKG